MHVEVLFDITKTGYKSWWFPAFGLIFFALGLILFLVNESRRKQGLPAIRNRGGKPAPWLPVVFMVFSLGWSSFALIQTYSEYRVLRSAFVKGRCRIIEGVIQNLQPENPGRGGANESFDVSGVKFSYSSAIVSPGFNLTVAKGSPLKNGMWVRVYFHERDIAKLELLNSPGATAKSWSRSA